MVPACKTFIYEKDKEHSMLKFDNIYAELYLTVFGLTLLFFVIVHTKINHLVSIIIIILISYAVYFYLQRLSDEKEISIEYKENTFDNDIKDREEVSEKIFYIDKFPKKCKYLKENQTLMDIAINIRFTKRFSKSRYSDIVLNLNKLMKIYIYILADRYDAVQYIPLFIDVKDNILELMYSFIMIIPEKLSHTYGFDPQEEINKSINDFTVYSKEMIQILENYARIHHMALYIPETNLRAFNIAQQSFYP